MCKNCTSLEKRHKSDKLLIIILSIAFLISALGMIASDYIVSRNMLKIRCVIEDESVLIDKERVKYFQDGVWYFDNGHARNCTILN